MGEHPPNGVIAISIAQFLQLWLQDVAASPNGIQHKSEFSLAGDG